MNSPIPYTPDVERIDQDETDVNADLADTFRQIIETTYRDLGHGFRGAHAKSHALLQARVRVLEGLPPHYAQGVFAQPGGMSQQRWQIGGGCRVQRILPDRNDIGAHARRQRTDLLPQAQASGAIYRGPAQRGHVLH